MLAEEDRATGAQKKLPYSTMAANTVVNRTYNSFIFYILLCYFVHAACTTTITDKKSMKNNHIIFLIVAKNRSLLAAVYVGDDLAANRWLRTLLLL